MRSRKDQQRISAQETTWIKELNSDISFLCDSWNELPASLKLCEQSTLGLHKVEHSITKREATLPFSSKFYMSQIIEWYLQTGYCKYCNLVWKNWANIESRSKSKWRCQTHTSSRWSPLKLRISDYRMESDLTRELQPFSANTDLIPDHKPSQLGMYSSARDKEES